MIMRFLYWIYRIILSLRYKIVISGTEILEEPGPKLILPNHPGLIDPQIALTYLNKYVRAYPVASVVYYNQPLLYPIFRMIGAVPIKDFEQDGTSAHDLNEVYESIVYELERGKNIVIYPSGAIYKQGFESILGKRAIYDLSKHVPLNTKIVGLRTTGLWGSRWTHGWNGDYPYFYFNYFYAIWLFLTNLIFFIPKRKVKLELKDLTKDLGILNEEHVDSEIEDNGSSNMIDKHSRKDDIELEQNVLDRELHLSLNEFNKKLEEFYNANGEEQAIYIPYYFYYNNIINRPQPKIIKGSLRDLSRSKLADISEIPKEIIEKINLKISQQKEIDIDGIKSDNNLITDLYFDSLDFAEIKSYVQSQYKNSSNPPILDIKTVSDLYVMAIGKSFTEEKLKECVWDTDTDYVYLKDILKPVFDVMDENIDIKSYYAKNNINILSLIKQAYSNNPNKTIFFDNILGMQTKRDIIIKAYLFADFIKTLKGKYIGIMLPSVVSTNIFLISCYLAGKIPVMLNWTVGKKAFEHCLEFVEVDKILSSRSFFDRVKDKGLLGFEDKMFFLEDWLKNISLWKKLSAIVKSKLFFIPKLDETAVILYTSGSEALPKAVALTHLNIIENIRGSLEIFDILNSEILLGFLPPFHSFGFTVNTILPLISGLRAAYTPDPNDSLTIVNMINHTDASAISSTPSFLKMILNHAEAKDLTRLNYVVTGAEKCSDAIFAKFEELVPDGRILEGYGITECSPVLTINPLDNQKKGSAGLPIGGIEIKIKDFDSNKFLHQKQQGLIYANGPSIFNGYLDKNLPSPFHKIGKIYYNTGDLGYLDEDGYLYITGRLKRFVKIAGEMVSLPAIESILQGEYGSEDEINLAVEAKEFETGVKFVMFSLLEIKKDEVNSFLRSNGVSNLIKIDEIVKVEEIPFLGTGKVDYKVLKNMIKYP